MALRKFLASVRREQYRPSAQLTPVIDVKDRASTSKTVSKALTSVKSAFRRPKPKDPEECLFLAHLPPEIRSEIYLQVFQTVDDEPNLVLQCTLKEPSVWFWATHSETKILRVCKQIYAEALPLLYRFARFVWTLQSYRPKVIAAVLEPMRPLLRNSICHIELMLIIRHDMHGWNRKTEELKASFAQLVKLLPGLTRADVQIHFVDADDRFLATQKEVAAAAAFINKVIIPLKSVERLCLTDSMLTQNEREFLHPKQQQRRLVLDEVRQTICNGH